MAAALNKTWTAVGVAALGFLGPVLISGTAAARLLPINACGTVAGVVLAGLTFFLVPLKWASPIAVILLLGGMYLTFNSEPEWGAALPGWMLGLAAGSILGDQARTVRMARAEK